MRVFISAAEASSDHHAAKLLKALRQVLPAQEPLEAWGMGGPQLKQAGLRLIVNSQGLFPMGFLEVLGKLPGILKALFLLKKAAEQADIAIFLDYPDFHFLLAYFLRKSQVPLVYYIPPKVWIWRKKRLFFLKKYFKKILCIFPFEKDFYAKYGVAATYVGNPLIDELPWTMSRFEARRKLGLSDEKVLVLMVGSRLSEVKRHLSLSLEAAWQFISRHPSWVVLVPFTQNFPINLIKKEWEAFFLSHPQARTKIHLSRGDAAYCMLAADIGLIKSGTSTLEAALLGCPHVLFYRPSSSTYWIFKHLIRYRGPVGLVNWVLGEALVEEQTGSALRASDLAEALERLILNPENQAAAFLRLKKEWSCIQSPSVCAAQALMAVVQGDL